MVVDMEMTIRVMMIIVIGLIATLLIVSLIIMQGEQSSSMATGFFDWIKEGLK